MERKFGLMASRFDRFTEQARLALTLAQEEASEFNHNYISAEHILLGLIRTENGIAAKVLTDLGVDLIKLRSEVQFTFKREEQTSSNTGLTPRAKRIVAETIQDADKLGHKHIGTEHLLLGLLDEGGGIAVSILKKYGVTSEKVHGKVVSMGVPQSGSGTIDYNI